MKSAKWLMPMFALLVLSTGLSAQTENEDNNWYFTPMLSYIYADSDRDADDDFGLMLGFGKQINRDWNLEFSANIDDLDFEDGGGEYKQRGLMADGLYFFDRDADWQTYGVVGAGIMSTDARSSDSTNPMFNVGVGTSRAITDSGIKFRADVRYRIDMDDESISSEDEFNDLMLNVGLTIPLGQESKAPQPEAEEIAAPVEKDSDNDGIMDSADNCPASAFGVTVDSSGCEIVIASTVIAPTEPKDTDNDGIADLKDQCPDSKPGASVDSKGCELKQSFVLEGVNFVTGSDELTGASRSVLDNVAETLIRNGDINVEVAGYTDDRGASDFNQSLSQKRAQSVKAYLQSSGVAAGRMKAKGYGEDGPIGDNSTSAGRAMNRRVELHIIE